MTPRALVTDTAELADAAADVTGNITGNVAGGERLPATGNCPPAAAPSWALFPAGLRVGLGSASVSAAAKSWLLALDRVESADTAPLACVGSFALGACETAGVAFIPGEIAIDVPNPTPPHGNTYTCDMKLTPVNAPSAPAASGGYSQAIEIFAAQRLLFISGQIPQSPGGDVPKEFSAQARLAWRNVLAQLDAASMSVKNLVKVTMFLSSRDFAAASREVRQEFLGTHSPALTVIIAGIFDEKWLLEIEATAAA
jgi:enamine deaminase RidA (YjgF/YER057c/UK114 family)